MHNFWCWDTHLDRIKVEAGCRERWPREVCARSARIGRGLGIETANTCVLAWNNDKERNSHIAPGQGRQCLEGRAYIALDPLRHLPHSLAFTHEGHKVRQVEGRERGRRAAHHAIRKLWHKTFASIVSVMCMLKHGGTSREALT